MSTLAGPSRRHNDSSITSSPSQCNLPPPQILSSTTTNRPSSFSSRPRSYKSSYHSISKHYKANAKILSLFHSLYNNDEDNSYSVAYAVGLQFVETALFEMPTHGYYYSTRHAEERRQNVEDAVKVTEKLEALVGAMEQDVEERRRRGEEGSSVEELERLIMETKRRGMAVEELKVVARESLEQNVALATDSTACSSTNQTTRSAVSSDRKEQGIHTDTKEEETKSNSWPYCSSDWFSDDSSWINDITQSNLCVRILGNYGIPDDETVTDDDDDVDLEDEDSGPGLSNRQLQEHTSLLITTPKKSETKEEITDKNDASTEIPSGLPQLPEKPELVSSSASTTAAADAILQSDLQQALYLSTQPPPETKTEAPFTPPLQAPLTVSTSIARTQKNYDGRPLKPSSPQSLPISTLSKCYFDDFESFLQLSKITFKKLSTYQGKTPGSVNGCTVIAPLLCIHFFFLKNQVEKGETKEEGKKKKKNRIKTLSKRYSFSSQSTTNSSSNSHSSSSYNDASLPEKTVHKIINVQAPKILPSVRTQLSISPDALIIPSDVHDYLMNVNLLSPTQFVGVNGGNILSDVHLDSFLEDMMNTKDKKVAATLFFHEHVVAIHKLRRGEKGVEFELIDSLPCYKSVRRFIRHQRVRQREMDGEGKKGKEEKILLLRWKSGASSYRGSYIEDISDGSGYHHSTSITAAAGGGIGRRSNNTQKFSYATKKDEDDREDGAIRFHCTDLSSLKVLLRWYACKKFTQQDKRYIDTYRWEDQNSDFDPRVFQAFIWAEKS